MMDVFLRERHAKETEEDNTDTQSRRQCEPEAEAGVTQPQTKEAKECWKGQEGVCLLWDSAGAEAPLTSWFQTCGLQICETVHFSCFKPLNLWYFVRAALRYFRGNGKVRANGKECGLQPHK